MVYLNDDLVEINIASNKKKKYGNSSKFYDHTASNYKIKVNKSVKFSN